jgi:tetratricopeptide (TPR) repeat protein
MKKIKKDNDAGEFVEKRKKLSPEDAKVVTLTLLYLKADRLFDEKKYDEVIQVVNEALKIDAEAMGFLALKFRACRKLKKIHLAKRILITMTKIDRDADTPDSRFGWPATQAPFYEEALPFLEPIIKKNLKNPVPIETKGRIFGILGKHDELLTLMEWAYKLEPRNHSAPIFREFYLYLIGRRDNPIDDINAIIKRTGTKNKKVLKYRDIVVEQIMENERSGGGTI